MREIIARVVCVLTLTLVVALSVVFAARHNRGGTEPPPSARPSRPPSAEPAVPSATIARGRQVFAEQSCGTCHAVAGAGNPRSILDGVGGRLNPAELREWITGSGGAAAALPASIVRRKRRYQELPSADLDALVAYLSSLKSMRPSP